ncbi:MAG TPA: hypothetical protein VK638_03015 [Edaphobacter sp.]|nr:hypothetical protein [Edaphobacter sp.]
MRFTSRYDGCRRFHALVLLALGKNYQAYILYAIPVLGLSAYGVGNGVVRIAEQTGSTEYG